MLRYSLLVIVLLAIASVAGLAFGQEAGLGVLPAQEVRAELRVPDDGLYSLPQGSFVRIDTIRVAEKARRPRPFSAVAEEPQPGEFRPRRDGALRFALADKGKRLTVTYQYCPRRLAVLPTVHGTDYSDVVPVVEETLRKELAPRGLVLVPHDRVVDALAEEGIRWPGPLPREAAGRFAALARRLEVAFLLVPAVSANREVLYAGLQTIGEATSIGTMTGTVVASGNLATVEGPPDDSSGGGPYSLASYKTHQSASVGLLVVEGETGGFIAAPADAGRRSVWIRIGNKRTRRSLVRALTASVIAQWREAG